MENRESKGAWVGEKWQRHDDSKTAVGVIFAGIAAVFIAGIAAVLIYAKDTRPMQTASAPAASINAPAPPIASTTETTGSGGGINYIPPKQHPREDEQRERP